jgi:hypothetical protein
MVKLPKHFVGAYKKGTRASQLSHISAGVYLHAKIPRKFALLFLRTGVMNGHDRSPVRRNE